jgi:hypothetical protein
MPDTGTDQQERAHDRQAGREHVCPDRHRRIDGAPSVWMAVARHARVRGWTEQWQRAVRGMAAEHVHV